MANVISMLLLAAVTIPVGVLLFILFRNELEIKERVTGGLGMPVIYGMLLVFVVMPIVVFLTS